MALLELYDSVKGDIIAHATIDDKHKERTQGYKWICRTTNRGYRNIYSYVDGQTVTLTIFLFGKPEQGNYIRKNKQGLDYREANVVQFQDSIAERMFGLVTELHSQDTVIPTHETTPLEECGRLKIGHWVILFDNVYHDLMKKYSWNISTRCNNGRFYCYIVRSSYLNKHNPTTVNLSRVLLGMQDCESGEVIPGMESMVAVYKIQPTEKDKIVDLRLSNLMRVSRSMMSYRRRAFTNKKTSPYVGVVRYSESKWTAVIKGRKDKKPVYLGTYATDMEAAQARDRFIIDQGLESVVRLNFDLEFYKTGDANDNSRT